MVQISVCAELNILASIVNNYAHHNIGTSILIFEQRLSNYFRVATVWLSGSQGATTGNKAQIHTSLRSVVCAHCTSALAHIFKKHGDEQIGLVKIYNSS